MRIARREMEGTSGHGKSFVMEEEAVK